MAIFVNDENRCFFMEVPQIIAHAVQDLINMGKDYTNPFLLYDAIFKVDFIGCSGRVKLNK